MDQSGGGLYPHPQHASHSHHPPQQQQQAYPYASGLYGATPSQQQAPQPLGMQGYASPSSTSSFAAAQHGFGQPPHAHHGHVHTGTNSGFMGGFAAGGVGVAMGPGGAGGAGASAGSGGSAASGPGTSHSGGGGSGSTCFSFTVVTYDGLEQSTAHTLAKTTAKVQALVDSLATASSATMQGSANTEREKHALYLHPKVSLRPPEPLVTHTHGRFEVNYACCVSGTLEAVAAARTLLLAANPTLTTITLKTNKRLILNKNDEMKPFVKAHLDAIMAASNTQITCQESSSTQQPPASPSPSHSSNGSTNNHLQLHMMQNLQNPHTQQQQQQQQQLHAFNMAQLQQHLPDRMDVEIMGVWSDIETAARLQTLVFLDELNGFTCRTIEMGFDLYPIITGRKRAVLNRIMEDSGGANIYMPSSLAACVAASASSVMGASTAQALSSNVSAPSIATGSPKSSSGSAVPAPIVVPSTQAKGPNAIYVTGPSSIVDVAIAKIQHLLVTKKQSLIRKQVRLIRRKIDWLIISKRDQVRKVMYDNGVHLQIPPLGSSSCIIDVVGDNTIYIERAVRALMELVCEFYMATVQVDPATPPTVLASTKSALPKVSQTARSEIITNSQGLEIYGSEFAVKTAVQMICELGFLTSFIREIKFRLELPLEHKEFINGKKSGKINKITKSCGCNVLFHEDLNEYNMVIDVIHQSFAQAMEGLKLLEDELPAEMSFFIPETYHKRIIGVGGKNIQRIMKKYGVYVKFSNAEEFALLGGYHENKDNVIARTPAKNAESLEMLKEAVFEVVGFQSDVTSSVSIPRVLHRSVKGQHGLVVSGIERGFGVKIVWPDKESGSDDIRVVGQEMAVLQAKAELLNLVPDVNHITIPYSKVAIQEINADEFQKTLKDQLQMEFGTELYINIPSASSVEDSPGASGSGLEITFIVYIRRGSGNWDVVKQKLFDFLDSKQVSIKREPKPDASTQFAKLSPPKTYDSFQHFNSKLLSSVSSAGDYSSYNASYSLFEPPGSSSGGTYSAPNLKNVFESAGGNTNLPAPNPPSQNGLIPPPRIQTNPQPHHLHSQHRSQTFAPMSAGPGIGMHHHHHHHPHHMAFSTGTSDNRWPQSAHTSTTFAQAASTLGSGAQSATTGTDMFSNSMFAHTDFGASAFSAGPRSALPLAGGSGGPDAAFMFSDYGGGDAGDASPRLGEQFSGLFSGLNLRNSGGGNGAPVGPPGSVPEDRRKMSTSKLSIGESEAENENVTFGDDVIWQLLYMDTNQSNQLDMFLASLDLVSHIAPFKSQDIDFNRLLTFSDSDLMKIGVKAFGARRRLIAAIRRFNQTRHSNQQFTSSLQNTGGQMSRQQQAVLPPVPQSPLQQHLQMQNAPPMQMPQNPHQLQPQHGQQHQHQAPSQQQQHQHQHQQAQQQHSNFLYSMHQPPPHPHPQQQGQLLTPSSTVFDFSVVGGGSGPHQQSSPAQKPLLPPPGLVIPQQQPSGSSGSGFQHSQYQQHYPQLSGGPNGHHHQVNQLPSPVAPSSPLMGSYSHAARSGTQ
ncbi:hypothetical protein BC830DRAFT_1093607 [Chytriomyces sp. MP71]|nr:hypothetical protein BC830DRAFT_1093607 [Chytriomyces sp. MP71]